jgi:hypothetical protein
MSSQIVKKPFHFDWGRFFDASDAIAVLPPAWHPVHRHARGDDRAARRERLMNKKSGPRWSTASFGKGVGTSPLELRLLGEHLHVCHTLRGRFYGLRCGVEAVQNFVAGRFVTSILVLTLLVSLGALAW